jgi:Protein of unknown function (DUF4239)
VNSMAIASIVFACLFAGAVLGIIIHAALPEHHLSGDTKDAVKVAIALVATMGALVLSLLISTAKSAYDTRSSDFVQISGKVVMLDRLLAHYGPEAKDVRSLLRRSVAAGIERLWPTTGARPAGFDPKAASPVEALYDKIEELSPQNESQRLLQVQALNMAMELGYTRLLLYEQARSSVPLPFLVVLVFWLTIIFASFGLFAPVNATVTTVFLVCALSVSGAIFLILELDQSFEGLIQVSSAPLRQALARLGQ